MTFPYPVPPAVVEETDALYAEMFNFWGRRIYLATFVLEVLNPEYHAVHTSPVLTGNQLKLYVYDFNVPLGGQGLWRFRLTIYSNYLGKNVSAFKVFTVDTGTVTPKGKAGAQIHVDGQATSVHDAAIKLRVVSSRKHNVPGSAHKGFSSSRPSRPNESATESYTRIGWLRSSWTAPWQQGQNVKTYQKSSRNWTGVRTPGFGTLKAKQLPVNPHTVSMRMTQNGPSIAASNNVSTGSASGELESHTKWYAGALEPQHLAAARDISIKRLTSKAQSGMVSNLALDLLEINKTLDMISGNASRIAESAKALRGGNIPEAIAKLFGSGRRRWRKSRRGPSAAQSVADNWLEMQYGWKPLIQNIQGAIQALNNYDSSGSYVVRTSSSAMVKTKVVTDVYAAITTPPVAGQKIVTTHSRCRLVMRWRISDPLKALLAQTGFTNPINLGWEILPFSFVADWFLPIGPYLESLSSWSGYVFVDGSQTLFTRQWTDIALSYDRVSPANQNQRDWGTSTYHDQWIKLNRSRLTAFPGLALPELKNGLRSSTRLANALALVKAVFLADKR